MQVTREIPQPGWKYRHWKGDTYTVVCIANTASDRYAIPMIVYQSATEFFYRPLGEFLEVLGDDSEGTNYYRFERIL
jgi:hypothetical protein